MNSNKYLWVNPSFLDYRIPLYTELNHILDGCFHLLYSKSRIPERCHIGIQKGIGENAHWIDSEKQIQFGNTKSNFSNTSVSIPFPKGLYGKIKKLKPNAIIAEGFFQFTPWAVWYSFLHRIPLYIAYERTAHTERNCPFWRRYYRKFINLFVNGYIANGQETKKYLISQGVKASNIITGGMCADSNSLKNLCSNMSPEDKKSFIECCNLTSIKGLRYIYVGQIIERKGVKYLLNAWKHHINKYPNDELLIVGNGDLLEKYKKEYIDIPSIKFMGGVDYSIIYKYYAISDVFVIPTLEDNWSLVVPEAMACGLPIACSIYNGCHPDLVPNGYNGFTFDPLSQESTVECLTKFHKNDLEKMGKNSIDLESKFSPEQTAQNIKSLIYL